MEKKGGGITPNSAKCTTEGECQREDSHKLPRDPVSTGSFSNIDFLSLQIGALTGFSSHLLTSPTTHPSVFNLLGREPFLLRAYFISSSSKKERKERNNLLWVRTGNGGPYVHRQAGLPVSCGAHRGAMRNPEALKVERPSWCFSKLLTKCLLVKMPIVFREAQAQRFLEEGLVLLSHGPQRRRRGQSQPLTPLRTSLPAGGPLASQTLVHLL